VKSVRGRPLVIGHRGFAGRFPDNSLAGVRAAIAVGADGVEVDVRRCAEGTWVCHHDRSRGDRTIAAWSLVALRREKVPTLAEVVDAVSTSRWLLVEIKPLGTDALTAGLAELRRLLAPRLATTMVISSSLPVLAASEAALPGLATSWVFDRMPTWLPNDVQLSPKHTLVDELLWTGRALHPWTVNRTRRLLALAEMGVTSVTTNAPDIAVEVLGG
jgi:glycerophosphoryl diester phosphodiesterase